TLLHERGGTGARADRVNAVAMELGVDLSVAEGLVDRAWARHVERWNRGETFTSRHMVASLLDEVDARAPGRCERLTSWFEEAIAVHGVCAVDEGVEVVTALKDAGIAVALICDTGYSPGRMVRRMLRTVGFPPFDAYAFSDEIGFPKPHPAMFQAALVPRGVEPGEALHVGDLRRTDIAGARAVGLTAVRFRGVYDDLDDAHPEGDAVIDRLSEVMGQVGRLSR
ncbi:MAG: HAD-IA family hydrolase, partial [Deltaproteobacteria bacterium]|nr:HAD-IA family hydrolase [Deltaproteobacteria bacterium]